jgi:two-component system, NtrC family, sensor kinase
MHVHSGLPAVAAGGERPRLPLPRTLRGKGLLAMAVALVYALAAAAYLTSLRGPLQADVAALDSLHRYERALAKAEVAVSNALIEVQEAAFMPLLSDMSPSRGITLVVEAATRAVESLVDHNLGAERSVRAIRRAHEALQAQPVRASWIDLRDVLRRVQEDIAIERDRAALQRQSLAEGYQANFDSVTRQSFVLLLGGVGAFGALVVLFFTRMTRDIARLQARASEIVLGERKAPLAVTRDDELGRLTRAVNCMADDLESRARQIELEQQRRAHQEKMATLGALAASVAHEVNNPLMTIAGVAQEMAAADSTLSRDDAGRRARQLLGEVQRLATVTRQIADVAAPRGSDLPWLDLNAMVRSMLKFVRYDKRYRNLQFDLALDPQLPAVRALPDPVELVVLQLLNEVASAVAVGGVPGGRIWVATQAARPAQAGIDGAAAALEISATGPVESGVVPQAAGHGLELCDSIVASLAGRLEVRREAGTLRGVVLWLPIEDVALSD